MKNLSHHGSILCFGELLWKICPDEEGACLENSHLPIYPGGTELNVAISLALWGLPAKYFTALPENGISKQLIKSIEKQRVDMSAANNINKQIDLCFLTANHDLKNSAIVYDRENSAFSGLKSGMIDWDKMFNGVSWFHFSAICPAINRNIAELCLEGLQVATLRNITISIDLGYKPRLWSYNKSPLLVMPELASYCDIIMGNIWATEKLLGIPVDWHPGESVSKTTYLKQARLSSQQIMADYPKCRAVANTFRFERSENVHHYATLYAGKRFYNSKEYINAEIMERVGNGDRFLAGIIHGFYHELASKEILAFATVAAFKQPFVNGDAIDISVY